MLKKRTFLALIILLLVTLLLRPWRAIVCQDDGTFAVTVLEALRGNFTPHPLSLAPIWVQVILGMGAVKILWFLPPLIVLNILSWSLFLLMIWIFQKLTRFDPILVVSFFLFPIWVQYGASFLYEIYNACLLGLLVWALNNRGKQRTFLIIIISGLMVIQQQALLAFPLGWGLAFWFQRDKRKEGIPLLLGALLGVVLYAILPKNPMQSAFFYWQAIQWVEMGFRAFPTAVGQCLSLILSVGVFLIPFLDLKSLTARRISLLVLTQSFFIGILWITGSRGLGGGVIFTDYLPRIVEIGFVSLGVWGMSALKDVREELIPRVGTILASVLILGFNTFRNVSDMRYVMILGLVGAFQLATPSRKSVQFNRLGSRSWAVLAMLGITLLSNSYNLDTNEARWNVANELETQGLAKDEISAGYGRDSFELGKDCAERALVKLNDEIPFDLFRSRRFFEAFYLNNTRLYEWGWQPKWIIKPATFFGKSLSLNKNRSKLQDSVPTAWREYRVLGIPHRLAIYQSEQGQKAWCFN